MTVDDDGDHPLKLSHGRDAEHADLPSLELRGVLLPILENSATIDALSTENTKFLTQGDAPVPDSRAAVPPVAPFRHLITPQPLFSPPACAVCCVGCSEPVPGPHRRRLPL